MLAKDSTMTSMYGHFTDIWLKSVVNVAGWRFPFVHFNTTWARNLPILTFGIFCSNWVGSTNHPPTTFGPQNHEQWSFFPALNVWVMTPKNEGFGVPMVGKSSSYGVASRASRRAFASGPSPVVGSLFFWSLHRCENLPPWWTGVSGGQRGWGFWLSPASMSRWRECWKLGWNG